MPPTPSRQHGGTATPAPAVPTPTYAEQARTLMHLGRVGTLSTQSRKQPGFPFGSVMPFGLDAEGRPLFLISTMAMHTQNLHGDPRASLLVMRDRGATDVLGAARVTLEAQDIPALEAGWNGFELNRSRVVEAGGVNAAQQGIVEPEAVESRRFNR